MEASEDIEQQNIRLVLITFDKMKDAHETLRLGFGTQRGFIGMENGGLF